ncbi:phosphoribosylglycinamide formyltransferase [Paenisporosarcina cavernae]|uniref:Phosphoribosylglycinamide formyltransferase n=1 Tax=Paenisporosarcina cavernae TaxID=2320858 RepID=A0A385YXA5_9BACL|nr:phosphoribosylglycinamide formyltransferase [Paenisporosarcina cavernae]AYC30308.1 phosphoribosylglycinamide formyltransferase [Paenisporosarcina cavernae]
MAKHVRFAVFASGNGSNFQALADAVANKKLDAHLVLLVTDRPGSFATVRAKQLGIEWVELSPRDFSEKAEYEEAILAELQKRKVEWIVLAGYMRLIGPTLLSAFPNRIVNIHPSLLPLYPGKDAIGQAIQDGASITGVTVHYVDAGMDTGPVISSQKITIDGHSRQEMESMIHQVEHQLYPTTLSELWGGNK